MLGYKDTHRRVSAVNAENDSGMFPLNLLLPRYLQSKQARLVVDEKGWTAATRGFTIDVAVGKMAWEDYKPAGLIVHPPIGAVDTCAHACR